MHTVKVAKNIKISNEVPFLSSLVSWSEFKMTLKSFFELKPVWSHAEVSNG